MPLRQLHSPPFSWHRLLGIPRMELSALAGPLTVLPWLGLVKGLSQCKPLAPPCPGPPSCCSVTFDTPSGFPRSRCLERRGGTRGLQVLGADRHGLGDDAKGLDAESPDLSGLDRCLVRQPVCDPCTWRSIPAARLGCTSRGCGGLTCIKGRVQGSDPRPCLASKASTSCWVRQQG